MEIDVQGNIYRHILTEIGAGHRSVLVTKASADPACAGGTEKSFFKEDGIYAAEDADSFIQDIVGKALKSGTLQYTHDANGTVYIAEPYYPCPRLIILGGGHISKPLAEFSAKCGFEVTVVDDRPAFANKKRFPYAKNIICESFDKCFSLLDINNSAFIVIITRGHRHDIDCLKQLLEYETAYTGMIGSARRVLAVREELETDGFAKEKIDAVRAPIGLGIGALTPEEIAISILSELIKYKRIITKFNWAELDEDVLKNLAEKDEYPRAVVTIIGTKGSVPRNTGAKMIVWPFGKTLGSIGGGCSEAAIIQTAHEIAAKGGFIIKEIDMTGDLSEKEVMACGGKMKVAIENYVY